MIFEVEAETGVVEFSIGGRNLGALKGVDSATDRIGSTDLTGRSLVTGSDEMSRRGDVEFGEVGREID